MLESMKKPTYPQQELANRLQAAMEESGVNLADLARACGVTIQAVHGWRETGRIGKHHLVSIAQMTKKPLEYFLVGLGRAAAVLLTILALLVPPAPADASPAFNINAGFLHIGKFLRRRIMAFYQSLLPHVEMGVAP